MVGAGSRSIKFPLPDCYRTLESRPIAELDDFEQSSIADALVEDWFGELSRNSLRDTATALAHDALAYAQQNGLDVRTVWERLAPAGFSVIDKLRQAIGINEVYEEADGSRLKLDLLWEHEWNPINDVQFGEPPSLSTSGVASAAGDYLKLPYRSPVLARIMIDALIASELYAYADTMMGAKAKQDLKTYETMQGILDRPASLIAPLPGWKYVYVSGWAALACLAFAIVALFIPETLIDATTVLWAALIAGGLSLLTLLVFIRDWRILSKAEATKNERLAKPLRAMDDVYRTLLVEGPVSAVRLREMAVHAEGMGVVWPASLYALLDDNIRRDGSI